MPVIPACSVTISLWAVLILMFLRSCNQRWQRWIDSSSCLLGQVTREFFIDVNSIAEGIYENQNETYFTKNQVMKAFLGFHYFTRCNTVSSFPGGGKLKPLKLLFKNSEYIDAFIFRRRYRTWRRNSKKAWKIGIKYVWEKANVLHIHQRFAVQHLLSKRRKGIISLATSLSQCAYTTQYVSQLSNVYLATVF